MVFCETFTPYTNIFFNFFLKPANSYCRTQAPFLNQTKCNHFYLRYIDKIPCMKFTTLSITYGLKDYGFDNEVLIGISIYSWIIFQSFKTYLSFHYIDNHFLIYQEYIKVYGFFFHMIHETLFKRLFSDYVRCFPSVLGLYNWFLIDYCINVIIIIYP